ncbi:MAG: YdcF family protein [Methyloceanibacter sp.]
MFFYVAKVLWFLLQPSTLIALLLAYGAILIWTGWARWGRRFVTVGAVLLLLVGLSPLGNALILPLEDRFPRANLDQPPAPTGFIVLGGAEDRLVEIARGAPAVNEAGERILETVVLARRFPDAKIAFSGGDAGIRYKADSEAAGAANLLTGMGVARDRLILEANSRDTYENAIYLKAELGRLGLLGAGRRWVLITSGFHMPRAMGAFRRAGLEVEPWPVDYRTVGEADLTRPFDKVSEGLRRVDMAAHEWVGLLAYWLAGRSGELFPAPAPVGGCDLAASRPGNPGAPPCRSNP